MGMRVIQWGEHSSNKIRFSTTKCLNKQVRFFKTNIVEQMTETIRTSGPIKQAALMIKSSLLSVDFDLNDRLCNAKVEDSSIL